MHLSPVLVEIIITLHPDTKSKSIHLRNSMIKKKHMFCVGKITQSKRDGFNLSSCATEEV